MTLEATPGTVRDHCVWRAQVHTRTSPRTWYQMQDLLVDEVSEQMLFLGESYVQVWERTDAMAAVDAAAPTWTAPHAPKA